jgi:hypothetical protein
MGTSTRFMPNRRSTITGGPIVVAQDLCVVLAPLWAE